MELSKKLEICQRLCEKDKTEVSLFTSFSLLDWRPFLPPSPKALKSFTFPILAYHIEARKKRRIRSREKTVWIISKGKRDIKITKNKIQTTKSEDIQYKVYFF